MCDNLFADRAPGYCKVLINDEQYWTFCKQYNANLFMTTGNFPERVGSHSILFKGHFLGESGSFLHNGGTVLEYGNIYLFQVFLCEV